MFATPVIRRELQVTGRDPALYWQRTAVAALAMMTAMVWILFSGAAPAFTGRKVFSIFSWSIFVLCLLEGARSAADALSGEKREGTLGLLFLTDLRPHEVVFGKLAFVSIRSVAFLVPVLPIFAVPLLLGGISGGESWRLMFTSLITVLFALSAALLASSVSVSPTAALGKTIFILSLMSAYQLFQLGIGRAFRQLSVNWTAGPLGMLVFSNDAGFRSNPSQFWLSAAASVLCASAMLVAAARLTRRSFATVPIPSKPQWWRQWLQPPRGYIAPWGEASEQSPALWLAQRTLPGMRILWTLICFALGACFVSGLFGSIGIAVALQVFFGIVLKLWVAVVAPQSLHDLRNSGALELILCTPLQPASIIRGQIDTLYESFIGPSLVIAIGFPISLYGGAVLSRDDIVEPAAMVPMGILWIIYTLLDLHALGYLGMWHGLTVQRIEVAIGKTVWYGLILPWVFVIVPVLGWAALVFWPVILMQWASKRLHERFHQNMVDTNEGAARGASPRFYNNSWTSAFACSSGIPKSR